MSNSAENNVSSQAPGEQNFIGWLWKLLFLALAVLAASLYVQTTGVEQTQKNLFAMAQQIGLAAETVKLELPLKPRQDAKEHTTSSSALPPAGAVAAERLSDSASAESETKPIYPANSTGHLTGLEASMEAMLDMLDGPLGKLMGLSMLLVGFAVGIAKSDFIAVGISVMSSSLLLLAPTFLRQML